MTFADWILSRSEAFRLLMMKFRDHKQDTVEAFSKVKRKHLDYERKFEEHSDRLKQHEEIIKLLHEKIGSEAKPKLVIRESASAVSAIVKRAKKR